MSPGGINDIGDLVGSFFCGAGYDRAFVAWDASPPLQPLSLGPGVIQSFAAGINSSRQIAGTWETVGTPLHAFIYQDGQVLDLGTLGGAISAAGALNDDGTVVGYSYESNSTPPIAFRWSRGVMEALSLPVGHSSTAHDINNLHQICGWMGDGLTTDRGFIWDNGKVTELPIPIGAIKGRAVAINELADVCGSSSHPNPNGSGTVARAILWPSSGSLIELGILPGFTHSIARDITDDATLVGQCTGGGGGFNHGFVWRDGAMLDLNSLLPANTGLVIKNAVAINCSGQIACEAYDSNTGEIVAALLTPLPPQPGDVNCDRIVNMDDLLAVISAWNTTVQPPAFGSGSVDLNGDGVTNIDDLLLILSSWTL